MDFDYTNEVITPDNTGTISIGGTGAIDVPKGTTAQRPAAPASGAIRFNTSNVKVESYNGTTWDNIATEAYVLSNSSSFSSQLAHTVFAGPTTGSAIPTFRTLALTTGDVSDVVISTPQVNQLLMYNGASWVNNATTPSSSSGLLSGWVIVGVDNLYYTDYTHNLGTTDVVIMLYNNVTGAVIEADSLVLSDANTVQVTVYGNSTQIRIVVIANGLSVMGAGVSMVNGRDGPVTLTSADVNLSNVLNSPQVVNAGGAVSIQEDVIANRPGAGVAGRLFIATDLKVLYRDNGASWEVYFASSGVVRTLTYYANSLDSPNTADFAVNALAPTISDPTNTAINVRSFSNTVEQGVALTIEIPVGAVSVTVKTKGKAQTAPASAVVVQNRIYIRAINDNAAIGAWSTAVDMASTTIPTNAFYQYNSQTFTLASLGLTVGGLYQLEFTRKVTGVTGGTNLAYPWLMAELSMEFA